MVDPPPDRSQDDTSFRLQVAAERRLLRGGLSGVTLRSVAAAAKANSALVSYHFSNLAGLLSAVGKANVDFMIADRRMRLDRAMEESEPEQRLEMALEAQIVPLLLPSAFGGLPHASTVVRELLNGQDETFKSVAVRSINDSTTQVCAVLEPLVPHLGSEELRLRLRLLAGAATYLVPRIDSLGLFQNMDGGALPKQHFPLQELMAFARGAILGPGVGLPG